MKTSCSGGPTCALEMAPPPPIAVLAPHVAAHLATHVRENNEMKDPIRSASKAARKAAKKAVRQGLVRKSAVDAVKARATARAVRFNQLETLMKSAPDAQTARSYAFMIAKEQLAAASEHDRLIAAMQRGFVPPSQSAAIAAASAPAVATATGAAINSTPHNPRGALASVFNGTYVPQKLTGQTELPSLREIHAAEKALRLAPNAEARERLGYQLTRMNLIRAHRLGEI